MAAGGGVIIVSGLPRSGTSMLMRMLSAGGCPILSDETRRADADNPNGYFECRAVTALARDNSIIDAAQGKAIKIVSPLLLHLPQGPRYRVIFMRRSLSEVIASQQKMLERNGKSGAEPADLHRTFTSHLASIREWLDTRHDITTLFMRHNDVISAPAEAAVQIAGFLGRDLDLVSMAAAVDRRLYRSTAVVKSTGLDLGV